MSVSFLARGCIRGLTRKPTLATHIRALASSHQFTADSSMDRSGSSFTTEAITFLDKLYELVRDKALIEGTDRNQPVTKFVFPSELEKKLQLDVSDERFDHELLLKTCKTIIDYSVRTAHPLFMNQLCNGQDVYSFAASVIVEALNTNQHSFEVAPVFMVIERYTVELLNKLVGYDDGDGIFLPGGNIGNMMGLHVARYHRQKDMKKTGLFGQKRHTIFTSEQAHYSLSSAAHLLGFGTDSIITVKTDNCGRLDVADLERKIILSKEQGDVPFFAEATSGTTVLGAFDPIDKMADICQKYDLWLHVDGALGGACLFSEKHRHLLKGLERVDSLIWNAHKVNSAQLQCTAFLIKHKNLLNNCNNTKAEYLYQQDKFYDPSYDVGDKSITCGRKADAIKLWMMIKARGMENMKEVVDSHFDKARYFTEQIREREGFRLVIPEFEFLNISFWYIPPSLRGQEETEEWWEKLAKVAPVLKERMMKQGTLMIGYQPLTTMGIKANFFRIVINNEQIEYRDLDKVISEFERLGEDL